MQKNTQSIIDAYLAVHDPYQKPESLGISIRDTLVYAKEKEKNIEDLTENELASLKEEFEKKKEK